MRKITAVGSIVILVLALSGCGGGGAAVNQDEAKEAFIVGFVSVFTASFGLAFGQPVPGASLDEETGIMTFDGFSIDELTGEDSGIEYTGISGTVEQGEDSMIADLTMEGGPVESLAFTMTSDQIQNDSGFSVTVTVNGKEMELDISQEDMQRE